MSLTSDNPPNTKRCVKLHGRCAGADFGVSIRGGSHTSDTNQGQVAGCSKPREHASGLLEQRRTGKTTCLRSMGAAQAVAVQSCVGGNDRRNACVSGNFRDLFDFLISEVRCDFQEDWRCPRGPPSHPPAVQRVRPCLADLAVFRCWEKTR